MHIYNIEQTMIYHAETNLPDGRVVPVVFEQELNTCDDERIDVNILENVAPYTMDELIPQLRQEFINWKQQQKGEIKQ